MEKTKIILDIDTGHDDAIALMMAQPSVIKRPVLVCGGKITVGFDADAYAALFQAAS